MLSRGVRLALSAICAVVFLITSTGLANADPTTIDDARAQLQKLEQEASEIDAQYAAVQEKVAVSTAKVATVRKDLEAQSAKVQALRSQVGQMALQQFQSRNVDTTVALLTTEDPGQFLGRLSTVSKANENANSLLQDFQTEQANLADMQRSADAELKTISADQARMSELNTQSDAKVKAAQAVLDRLTADQRRQLEEQRAAEAERAADAVRAAQAVSRSTTAPRPVATQAPAPAPVVSGTASERARGALAFAMAQIGDRYVMGGTGPDAWDCSGLMMVSYRSVGVSIPRTSQAQYTVGQRVGLADLQPGDLVFFYSGISHVGMYIGNGQMVHASTWSKPVLVASMNLKTFQGGRRVA